LILAFLPSVTLCCGCEFNSHGGFDINLLTGYSILVTHEGHDYAVVPDAGPAATKAYANYDGTLFQFFKIATALKNAKLAAAPVTDASMDIGLLVVKQTSTDQRSGQKKGGKPTAGSGTTTPVGTPMTRVVSGSGSLPLTQLPNPKAAVSGDFTAPLQKLKTAAAPEDAAEQAAMQSAHAKCYSSQICLPIEIMTTAPDYRHGVFSMRQISQSVVDEYALQLVSNPFSMLPVILAAVVGNDLRSSFNLFLFHRARVNLILNLWLACVYLLLLDI